MILRRKKYYKIILYEDVTRFIIQRRVLGVWVNLYNENGRLLVFDNPKAAEQYISDEKKFGEEVTISYEKKLSGAKIPDEELIPPMHRELPIAKPETDARTDK